MQIDDDQFNVFFFLWTAGVEDINITEDHVTSAFRALKAHKLSDILPSIEVLATEICKTEQSFKPFYKWIFKYSSSLEGIKNLYTDIAVTLWKIAFSKMRCEILDDWIKFCEENADVEEITCDQWNMFLEFSETYKGDFSTYEKEDSWPPIFDEFVERQNEKNK